MTERKHKTVRLVGESPDEYRIDDAINRAIAAIEGESGLVKQLVSVHHSWHVDGCCFVTVLADVEKTVKAKEDGFAIHPLLLGDEIALKDLRPGAIFMTPKGNYAVKSEYYYPSGQCECVLLSSGERAYYERRDVRYRGWERVHIVDGPGLAPRAVVRRFTGQHGWVDVKELEIRITSGYATTPLAPFMKGV